MFKTFASVLTNNRAAEDDISKMSPFLFRRYLSNHPKTIAASNFLNVNFEIPIEAAYDFIQQSLKANNIKIGYIPYLKSTKENTINANYLSEYYNVSLNEAKDYLEYISNEQMLEIKEIIELKRSLK